jgi:4-amino-4-deoxy-L-arabinose transferase-like glycosyltransferase
METTPTIRTLNFALPLSLPRCLPILWSRLLFPGNAICDNKPRLQSLLILTILPGLLLYSCMSFCLFEPDEGRYAEIPREMLERGEWVVPLLQGEPYLDKPPLLYWLVAASYRIFGIHDWAARLIPALAVHATVLLTYALGRHLLGERSAFWGALFLALAPGFVGMGRLLILDGLLTLWVTLSLLAAFLAIRGERLHHGYWLLSALACGLGVLTKGPVAIVLLVPALVAYRWLTSSSWRLGVSAWLRFAAVVLAVALPWYIAVCAQLPHFARYFLWEHNVVRFLTPFDHLRPIWFYGPVLLFGLLPATLLAWPCIRILCASDDESRSQRTPELGYLMLAGGWCVLFFSLSGCKLPTYILPAFPPLALVLGQIAVVSGSARGRWLPASCGLVALSLAITHWTILPWYALHHSPMGQPDLVRSYCADPSTPIVCYPRNCDSVSFYLGRNDLRSYRSKQTHLMIQYLLTQPRAVVLFMHRHSLETLRAALPNDLHLVREAPLFGSARSGPEGQCYLAIVERQSR